MDAWLQQRGVTLVGADLDESPMAYRRLPEVLAQHAGTDPGAAHAAAVRGGDGGRGTSSIRSRIENGKVHRRGTFSERTLNVPLSNVATS